jgi:hypothetical protein
MAYEREGQVPSFRMTVDELRKKLAKGGTEQPN